MSQHPLRSASRYPLLTLLALGGPWACSGNVNIIDGTSSGGSKSGGAKSSGGDNSLAGETSSGGARASGGKSSAGGNGEATGGAGTGASAQTSGGETGDGGADATGGTDGGTGGTPDESGGAPSGGTSSGGASSGGTSSGGAGPVDECTLNTDNCDQNATCTNTTQSFTCACNAGYSGTGTVTNCLDINECQTGAHNCSGQANCTNTSGSFGCTCRMGYTGNGQQCSDINECQTGAHNCSVQADCGNTTGSFTCACKSGYSGTGQQCDDINECQIGTDNCNDHATCSNTGGSFSCACNPPYYGSGVSCACRAKSSTNVIVQGGLDTSASFGVQSAANGYAVWANGRGGSWVSNQDAESCPDSGALQIVTTGDASPSISTVCVPVTPNTSYFLGLKYKRTAGGKFYCQPTYYSESGCMSGIVQGQPSISVARASSDDAGWLSVASSAAVSPSNAQSAQIACYSELASNDAESATWVWLDQIYFNSSSAKF